MKIFIDIDEVLAEFLRGFCTFHNSTFSSSLTWADFHSYRFNTVLNCTRREAVRKIDLFYRSRNFLEIEPVDGAIAALKELRNHTLCVMTSRPKRLEKTTRAFLDQYFKGLYSELFFARGYPGCTLLSKEELILKEKGELAVDDFLPTAREISKRGIPVLLLAKPWNRANGTLERKENWGLIAQHVNALARQ